jgi:hypothetical protein
VTKFWRENRQILPLLSRGLPLHAHFVTLVRLPWLYARTIFLPADNNNSDTNDDDNTHEALLVIFPDAGVRPEAYLPLAREMQRQAAEAYNLRLHVGLARWLAHRPTWLGLGDAQANLLALSQRAKGVSHIFVLGHGVGSALSLPVSRSCTGTLRYGSVTTCSTTTTTSSLLASYPKPLLTLVGDVYDTNSASDSGVSSYLQLATLLDEFESYPGGSTTTPQAEDTAWRKPVIAVPGLHRSSFLDPAVRRERAAPTAATLSCQHDATRQVATLSLDFIRSVLSQHTADTHSSSRLRILQRDTQSRLQPYCALLKPMTMITLATELQYAIYRGSHSHKERPTTLVKPPPPFTVVVHFHQQLWDFLFAKPTIQGCVVRVHVYEQGPLMGNGQVLLVASTYAVKCKSRAALQIAFEKRTELADERAASFLDVLQNMNRSTFTNVLDNIVSPEQKEHYLREGVKLDFGLDVDYMDKGSLKWVASDLALQKTDKGWTVSSSIGVTVASGQLPEKFRGMHYGKVLTPAQCYEWIVSPRPAIQG